MKYVEIVNCKKYFNHNRINQKCSFNVTSLFNSLLLMQCEVVFKFFKLIDRIFLYIIISFYFRLVFTFFFYIMFQVQLQFIIIQFDTTQYAFFFAYFYFYNCILNNYECLEIRFIIIINYRSTTIHYNTNNLYPYCYFFCRQKNYILRTYGHCENIRIGTELPGIYPVLEFMLRGANTTE